MKLTIESPHLKPGRKLEDLVYYKSEHLAKIYERIEDIEIIFRRTNEENKKNCYIEIRIMVPGKVLFASEYCETFEEALHKVMEDIEHQLHRHKETLNEVR